jgi:hypothetical protein
LAASVSGLSSSRDLPEQPYTGVSLSCRQIDEEITHKITHRSPCCAELSIAQSMIPLPKHPTFTPLAAIKGVTRGSYSFRARSTLLESEGTFSAAKLDLAPMCVWYSAHSRTDTPVSRTTCQKKILLVAREVAAAITSGRRSRWA